MQSYPTTGIVLKRTDTGELDRIVTIFSKDKGKIVCVAKGSRKLNSSKLAALEPGCYIKVSLVETKGLPILTQAKIIDDFAGLKSDLSGIRNTFQILEMLDALLVEYDPQEEVFEIILSLLGHMRSEGSNKTAGVRISFARILAILGFTEGEVNLSQPLHDYIESLTQRRLKAFAYLSS